MPRTRRYGGIAPMQLVVRRHAKAQPRERAPAACVDKAYFCTASSYPITTVAVVLWRLALVAGLKPVTPEPRRCEPGWCAGRTGHVGSAAETLRLGTRGRGPHSGRRGLRGGACGSAFRHGADGKRERAAPRRHQARSAARHGAGLASLLHQRALRSCRAHLRKIISRARPRPGTRLCERARRRRLSARRGGRAGRARLGRRRRRDRDAVRRRVERVRRRRVQAQRPQGRGHDRPAPNGQSQGDRQDLARRADRGRHLRPRARSAAAPTLSDAAPLPAELRIFDARRLDCDARRRPLRHAAIRTSTISSNRCAPSRREA